MEYRKLGRSGLKVSPICLGAMMFGGPADEAQSQRMIAAARDAGINFIDTADVYNGGQSEEVVGRAIRNERDHWVIATKLNGIMGPGPNQRGSSRKWIFEAARRSLARLGTDYIDVYYLHREDLETPLEESVHALGDLVRAGHDPLLRPVQSQGVAHRRDLQHLRPHRPRSAGRHAAALQCAEPHGRGRAVPGGQPTTVSASCPTVRWRAACCRASTRLMPRRRPTAAPRATTPA